MGCFQGHRSESFVRQRSGSTLTWSFVCVSWLSLQTHNPQTGGQMLHPHHSCLENSVQREWAFKVFFNCSSHRYQKIINSIKDRQYNEMSIRECCHPVHTILQEHVLSHCSHRFHGEGLQYKVLLQCRWHWETGSSLVDLQTLGGCIVQRDHMSGNAMRTGDRWLVQTRWAVLVLYF